jgi:hypothetical protein
VVKPHAQPVPASGRGDPHGRGPRAQALASFESYCTEDSRSGTFSCLGLRQDPRCRRLPVIQESERPRDWCGRREAGGRERGVSMSWMARIALYWTIYLWVYPAAISLSLQQARIAPSSTWAAKRGRRRRRLFRIASPVRHIFYELRCGAVKLLCEMAIDMTSHTDACWGSKLAGGWPQYSHTRPYGGESM